jgi:hypothetical protein
MSEKDFPEWINVFIASTYMKSSRPSIEATLPALENAEAIEDEKSDFPFSPASLESLHFDDVLDAASSKHRRDSRSKASKVHVTFVFRQEINVNFKVGFESNNPSDLLSLMIRKLCLSLCILSESNEKQSFIQYGYLFVV